MQQRSIHPAAEIFPLMEGKAFEELVNDIKTVGLREPVVLCGGAVLDGRNRLRACERAKVEPTFTEFDGPDPLRFVISKNLIRRHLKEGQRALIAANLGSFPHGGNQHTRGTQLSISEAAQLLNVSPRSVADGITIRKAAISEIRESVQQGVLSVSSAARVSKLTAEKQREIFNRGKRAVVSAARKSRKNHAGSGRQQYAALWKCVDAICDALERSQLDKAHSAGTDLLKELKRVAMSRRSA